MFSEQEVKSYKFIIDQYGSVISSLGLSGTSLFGLKCYSFKGNSEPCKDCPVKISLPANSNKKDSTSDNLLPTDVMDLSMNRNGFLLQFNGDKEDISPLILNLGNAEALKNITKLAEYTATLNQEMERDLNLGGKLQNSLLPNKWKHHNIDLDFVYRPLSKVSGDVFDILKDGEKGVFFWLADVNGHGVAPALITVLLKSYVYQHFILNESNIDIEAFANFLNDQLCGIIKSGDYATMFMGYIDLNKSVLKYVCFGHPAPIIISNKVAAQIKLEANLPLMMMEDFKFKSGEVILNDGDILILYTDGITEGASPINNSLYGIGQLQKTVQDFIKQNENNINVKSVIKGILADYSSFVQGRYNDDVTLACIQINNKQDEVLNEKEEQPQTSSSKINVKELEDIF